jgi:hypothetical protein
MASADTLLTLILFESIFITLFGMYASTTCTLGLSIHFLAAPSASGVVGTLEGVLVGLANLILFVINAFVVFAELISGVGVNCGFPSWYITIFQLPILITVIYLCIPFVK